MSHTRDVPTLDDVARRAGVSTATVSRCLNTPERVIEKTRLTVLQAVEDIGYTPNFGARVMAAKRTFTIGAIIPTMENAIFARGLQAFQERLNEKGYTLLVSSTGYRPEVEAEQIRTLIARGADGLLLIGHERDEVVYRYLKQQNTPSLVAWAYDTRKTATCIGFDNRASMRALADRVVGMGHSKIAYISGEIAGNDRAADRWAGIRDAMEAKGIDPDTLRVEETTYDIDSGAIAFEKVIAAPVRPTVIMCGNDVLAVGAVRQAREMELSVPQDVSITGFDDIELASIVTPQLTTVHVPHRMMGHRAADMLIDMVTKGAPCTSELLQSEVKMRASLGAV